MRVATVLVILLLGGAAAVQPFTHPYCQTDLFEEVQNPIYLPSVKVESKNWYGSGIVIRRENGRCLILTAEHLVEDEKTFTVSCNSPGRKLAGVAQVVKVDQELDLAILDGPDIFGGAATLVTREQVSKGKPKILTQVIILGYPNGLSDPTLTEGRVQTHQNGMQFRVTAPIIYGNSGGGIFAKIDGKWLLVSIVTDIGLAGSHPIPHMCKGPEPAKILEFLGR